MFVIKKTDRHTMELTTYKFLHRIRSTSDHWRKNIVRKNVLLSIKFSITNFYEKLSRLITLSD